MSYINSTAGYGTEGDSSVQYAFVPSPVPPPDYLAQIYEGNGLFARIIDMPSDKAFDDDFPSGIRFEMTEAEIEAVQGSNYTKTDAYGDRKIMEYSDGSLFRLDNGKLTSMRIAMSESRALVVLDKYGDAGKEKTVSIFGMAQWTA